MTIFRGAVVGAALSLALGCGGGGNDAAFVEATPDFAGLSLELTAASSEGTGTSAAEEDAAFAQVTQGLTADQIDYVSNSRAAIKGLNTWVKTVIAKVHSLTAGEPNKELSTETIKVYGPTVEGNLTFKLSIRKVSAERYAWRLEAKKNDADDASYVRVLAGALAKGEQAHRGRGVLGVDLTALNTLDSAAYKGSGRLLAGFSHVNGAKALAYRLAAFTPDASLHDPVTAAFVGHKLADGRTGLRVATRANLPNSATDAKELLLIRLRFNPGVGGRAGALVSGGDVPADKVFIGRACWDATEQNAYKAPVLYCTKGAPETCTPVTAAEGEQSACKAGTELDPPGENADHNSTAGEEGAPDDVTPPMEMPSGET